MLGSGAGLGVQSDARADWTQFRLAASVYFSVFLEGGRSALLRSAPLRSVVVVGSGGLGAKPCWVRLELGLGAFSSDWSLPASSLGDGVMPLSSRWPGAPVQVREVGRDHLAEPAADPQS